MIESLPRRKEPPRTARLRRPDHPHPHSAQQRFESAWVHYKLDLGIDHLLVDEAQDTSPEQWDIIKRFVAEFTTGAGARGGCGARSSRSATTSSRSSRSRARRRKHSPRCAASSSARTRMPGCRSGPYQFKYSFRSAPDGAGGGRCRVQAASRPRRLDASLPRRPCTRRCARRRRASSKSGPLVKPDERPDVDPWDAPFDTVRSEPRSSWRGRSLAAVKSWLDRGDLVGEATSVTRCAGDILILVRQRGALFEAIIRAIKTAGVPVAGADRLMLTEHIAVMDLLVLADALLLPADDLALATILKSPLFGLAEEELFELAHGRRGALRAALRARRPDLAARLDALGESRTSADAVRLLRGPARRRRRPQEPSCRGSARRPTTPSTNFSISRSITKAARRRRCRASSRGCAPRRPRSSATWRWCATRFG